jgi:hypothetical protein
VIGRGTFIRVAAVGVVTPSFAGFQFLATVAAVPANDVALKIVGWDLPGDEAGEEHWIAVHRSWRTAWR